jgi:hypothetical protein
MCQVRGRQVEKWYLEVLHNEDALEPPGHYVGRLSADRPSM